MSTLNVSNITDGTDTVGTSYVVNGSAKAWVNFNGQGTIATRDSLNVSSLTDNATGSYDINLNNAFDSQSDYVPTSGNLNSTSNTNFGTTFGSALVFYSSRLRVTHYESGALVDTNYILILFHGDLA